ncbi:Gibberellin 20-oxidase [Dorcoceras hygrometricum]|uniref:Gibberellin 20-oxidase n=1 Tax=Dorcoceras hygrometricum TaxID=472368 RepID=A0A2Z7ABG2_9LAMI|nr:Gibberellin 20-oxidase [Dorcoceras hygrometricum]
MDSSASTLILTPSLNLKTKRDNEALLFDLSLLEKQPNFPTQFLWPREDLAFASQDELKDPPIDLNGYFNHDQESIGFMAKQIRHACLKHGYFQVVNHGVDERLIWATYEHMDAFFKLPLSRKLGVKRKEGRFCGYSGAHADRYSTKSVYQKYCESMENLSLIILELLAISLGLEGFHYRDFFEDGNSIMRGNNYPPCKEAGLTFGTGPHSDPNSVTILHQDQVGGLEIFADNKWQTVRPRPDAFVVNIGDTFMALCNGRYKSCLHRAVVNKERARRSLVFFVNPKEDKIVRPPKDLIHRDEPRQLPRLHMLRFERVHAESLSGGHYYPPKLHQLASVQPQIHALNFSWMDSWSCMGHLSF